MGGATLPIARLLADGGLPGTAAVTMMPLPRERVSRRA
jgi:hypothetical protein